MMLGNHSDAIEVVPGVMSLKIKTLNNAYDEKG